MVVEVRVRRGVAVRVPELRVSVHDGDSGRDSVGVPERVEVRVRVARRDGVLVSDAEAERLGVWVWLYRGDGEPVHVSEALRLGEREREGLGLRLAVRLPEAVGRAVGLGDRVRLLTPEAVREAVVLRLGLRVPVVAEAVLVREREEAERVGLAVGVGAEGVAVVRDRDRDRGVPLRENVVVARGVAVALGLTVREVERVQVGARDAEREAVGVREAVAVHEARSVIVVGVWDRWLRVAVLRVGVAMHVTVCVGVRVPMSERVRVSEGEGAGVTVGDRVPWEQVTLERLSEREGPEGEGELLNVREGERVVAVRVGDREAVPERLGLRLWVGDPVPLGLQCGVAVREADGDGDGLREPVRLCVRVGCSVGDRLAEKLSEGVPEEVAVPDGEGEGPVPEGETVGVPDGRRLCVGLRDAVPVRVREGVAVRDADAEPVVGVGDGPVCEGEGDGVGDRDGDAVGLGVREALPEAEALRVGERLAVPLGPLGLTVALESEGVGLCERRENVGLEDQVPVGEYVRVGLRVAESVAVALLPVRVTLPVGDGVSEGEPLPLRVPLALREPVERLRESPDSVTLPVRLAVRDGVRVWDAVALEVPVGLCGCVRDSVSVGDQVVVGMSVRVAELLGDGERLALGVGVRLWVELHEREGEAVGLRLREPVVVAVDRERDAVLLGLHVGVDVRLRVEGVRDADAEGAVTDGDARALPVTVGDRLADWVGLLEEDGVAVGVGLALRLRSAVADAVADGLRVGAAVSEGVREGVADAVRKGLGEREAEGVGVAVPDLEGLRGDAVGLADGGVAEGEQVDRVAVCDGVLRVTVGEAVPVDCVAEKVRVAEAVRDRADPENVPEGVGEKDSVAVVVNEAVCVGSEGDRAPVAVRVAEKLVPVARECEPEQDRLGEPERASVRDALDVADGGEPDRLGDGEAEAGDAVGVGERETEAVVGDGVQLRVLPVAVVLSVRDGVQVRDEREDVSVPEAEGRVRVMG